jgi:hypothetical protein
MSGGFSLANSNDFRDFIQIYRDFKTIQQFECGLTLLEKRLLTTKYVVVKGQILVAKSH